MKATLQNWDALELKRKTLCPGVFMIVSSLRELEANSNFRSMT
jgi:hypothetical protein